MEPLLLTGFKVPHVVCQMEKSLFRQRLLQPSGPLHVSVTVLGKKYSASCFEQSKHIIVHPSLPHQVFNAGSSMFLLTTGASTHLVASETRSMGRSFWWGPGNRSHAASRSSSRYLTRIDFNSLSGENLTLSLEVTLICIITNTPTCLP